MEGGTNRVNNMNDECHLAQMSFTAIHETCTGLIYLGQLTSVYITEQRWVIKITFLRTYRMLNYMEGYSLHTKHIDPYLTSLFTE